jgi:hypothetical protein
MVKSQMPTHKKGAFPWKVRGLVSKGNYTYAIVPEHPNATINGYVLEHRIVIENTLNRLLTPEEIVHHKDGERKNNRPENLEVMTRVTHGRHHQANVGKQMVRLRCPECERVFVVEKRQSYLQKGTQWTSCSKACRGKFAGRLAQTGKTREVEDAISANLLGEFRLYKDNAEVTQNQRNRRGHTHPT